MSDSQLFSLAIGLGSQNRNGEWLEVYYPQPLLHPDAALLESLAKVTGYTGGNEALSLSADDLPALSKAFAAAGLQDQAATINKLGVSKSPLVLTIIAEDCAPTSVPEVYLKLQLLSHRLIKPHATDLSGMFGLLPNVAWTSAGAIAIDELPERQLEARLNGEVLNVLSVDKFPKMANYVVPTGVRIGNTDQVRLGAHLGEGTTVMHAGFVNFNAGTLGTSMVEGRVSAGVVVGNGSDLGGGSSTMGTLSGGGNIVISVGEESLLGANSGLGIPLGDRCTIESGLYITAGAKVTLLDDQGQVVESVKARDLAGKPDLLFRRNSNNGRVECLTNKSAIALNEELHANN